MRCARCAAALIFVFAASSGLDGAAAESAALQPAAAASPSKPNEVRSTLPGRSFTATFAIQDWLKKELAGGDYSAELARAYQERADEEAGFSVKGDGNWLDATAFYAKSVRAHEGGEVGPWAPGELGLSDPALVIVYNATVSRSVRFRQEAPDACAQMVALYDHWLEQRGEGASAAGRAEHMFASFAEAFKACGGEHRIHGFPIGACRNTDRDARLPDRPEAGRKERMKTEAMAAALGEEEASGLLAMLGVSIRVEGRASGSGGAKENQRLARCRAEFVRDLLLKAGVSADRIAVDVSASAAGRAREAYADRLVVVLQE